MERLADLDSASDELGAGGLDVGDDEVQAPHGAGRRIRDPRADGYRARRARWRHLHDAKRIAGAVVDVQVEAHLLDVEGLGPVDIRDGQQHQFQFPIHVACLLEVVGRLSVTGGETSGFPKTHR